MGCVQGGGMDHGVNALHRPCDSLVIGDIGNDAGGGEWAAIQPHHFVEAANAPKIARPIRPELPVSRIFIESIHSKRPGTTGMLRF